MICKNCGLIAGESATLFNDDKIVCAGCGYSPPEAIINKQLRSFRKQLEVRAVSLSISAGDLFIVDKVGISYSKVSSKDHYMLKELPNKYILEDTEVVK